MLAELTEGAPKAEAYKGKVALYADDDGRPHGFLLSDAAASTAAMRLLAAIAKLGGPGAVLHRAECLEIDIGDTLPEPIVRLTFTIEGAPVAVELDPTQFAELAAAVAVVSREIDAGKPPRRDG